MMDASWLAPVCFPLPVVAAFFLCVTAVFGLKRTSSWLSPSPLDGMPCLLHLCLPPSLSHRRFSVKSTRTCQVRSGFVWRRGLHSSRAAQTYRRCLVREGFLFSCEPKGVLLGLWTPAGLWLRAFIFLLSISPLVSVSLAASRLLVFLFYGFCQC